MIRHGWRFCGGAFCQWLGDFDKVSKIGSLLQHIVERVSRRVSAHFDYIF